MDSATDSAIYSDKIGTIWFSTVGFIRASITLSAIVCFFLLTQVWILTTRLLRLLFESGYKILWAIRARPFSRVCSFLCVYKRFYCSFWIETRLRAGWELVIKDVNNDTVLLSMTSAIFNYVFTGTGSIAERVLHCFLPKIPLF